MAQIEEFYRLLDVRPDASAEEIRSAYLTLVNVWHPDRFAHDQGLQSRAAEKLRAVNAAFELIKQAPLRTGRAPRPAEPVSGREARMEGPEPRSAAEWFQLGLRLANTRVEIKPDESLTWSNIGDVNRHREGIRAFQEAIRLQPDFAEAWFGMGMAHAQFHQFIEAARAFSETVRLRPGHVSAWINLGSALAPLQRYAEVIQAFREAVRLKPGDASAWYTLGVAYAHPQIHQLEDARQAFAEAVRLRPDLAEAWHELGKARRALRPDPPDTDEAVAAFREAVRLKPDLAEAWCSLGATLNAGSRHDEAADALLRAVQLKPDLADAWFGLGTASRLGRRPDAAREIEDAYANLRRLDRDQAARLLETLPLRQRLRLSWRGER
jgi:cytochrome c-type biogenesis protein CcmH/NrfG